MSISLGARIKTKGEGMCGEHVELMVQDVANESATPYERLLTDALRGDATLFVRQDSVEAAWSIVDPILGDVAPVHEYEPGTWGPPEADSLITAYGGWHDPQPVDESPQTN